MGMLDGKVALVTGAGSGIGRATALRFAREGARVIVADIAEGDTRSEIERAGGVAMFAQCDVSNPEQVRKAVEDTVGRFGQLDIVVANAGINGVWAPIEELEPEEWDKTLNVNLKGTYLTLHFAVPHLKERKSGSIIIVSSVNGNRTFSTAGSTAYSASKAGQVAIMKMQALELGRHRIRVNAVCPGAIHTHIEQSTKKHDTDKIGLDLIFPKGSPAINGGEGEPDDVADVCLFLASELSRHVSGVEIYVDGGQSLMR
ncbi:MAG: putative short-chain dehydrogenase [Phycisphaerales bacterium]|nr:putative short-chain dehydrogenase [Phycisphaerales bacterium]